MQIQLDDTVQVLTINENNGIGTKEANSLASITTQSLDNCEAEKKQIQSTTNLFNQQLKDYKSKHKNQRSLHISSTDIGKHASSDPSKSTDILLERKIPPPLDQQLREYRRKHDRQHTISTTKQRPTKCNKKPLVPGRNRQAASSRPRQTNYRVHNQTQHRSHRTSLPFRLGLYPSTRPRSREWVHYLNYVNRVMR